MKYFLSIFVLFFLICAAPAFAGNTITLPNGQTLNVENLTDEEILQAVKVAKKSMGIDNVEEKAKSAMDFVAGVDPNELDAWRKLITGTIKDVCNDLSITVNEFVKTPVGFGIAALIVYRVAGEDLLDDAIDFVIMIPLWGLVSIIILFFAWYFYSMKTVYDIKYDKDTGRFYNKNTPKHVDYDWRKEGEQAWLNLDTDVF